MASLLLVIYGKYKGGNKVLGAILDIYITLAAISIYSFINYYLNH
jgi:hypothetical protein